MEKIKRRQRLLNFLSDTEGRFYYDGPIDGIDGPGTRAGAERFLEDYGFTMDELEDLKLMYKVYHDPDKLNGNGK